MSRKNKNKAIEAPKLATPPGKKYIKDFESPQAVQRIKQDIAKWRMAIQEAENPITPQRYLMQQMFIDTVLNGHVTACMEKRYANVLKKGIEVVNEKGEQNEALTKLYSKRWMFDILRYSLDAKMYGYTLIQLGDMKNYEFDELYTIRRANINPEEEIVTESFYSNEGISVKDPLYEKNLIWVKTPSEVGMVANWGKCGNGLLYKVAPYEIWYRQAITLWNVYQQKYGIPQMIGKTNSRDEQMRSQMADMLANVGPAGWAVLDLEDIIEPIDVSQKPGGNEVFSNMMLETQKVISKIILGHADALDSVPGKLGASQGDQSPAFMAMKDIEAFDCQFLEFELEKNIIPKLIGLGFPMPKGQTIKFINSYEKMEARAAEDQNNKLTSDLVKTLSDAGLKVDAKWFTERTNIPVEDKPEPKPEPIKKTKNAIKEREYLQNKIEELYGSCNHD
jgi:phage gp29-like protein